MEIYETLEKETGFNADLLRRIERLQISQHKLQGEKPPTEDQFIKVVHSIRKKMNVLQLDTILYMMYAPKLSYGGGTKVGPGFERTQLQEQGTGVIHRHHYDTKH